MKTEMQKHAHKVVGAGADGASVNMGCKNGLLTKWQQVCEWLFKIHCFAHRLELAVEESKNDIYSDITTFLNEIYIHFRNSSKEWCSVLKVGEIKSPQIFTIPKPFGTHFAAHVRNLGCYHK